MRIFITGGAGFIGSHLCEEYLSRGDEVWALDDLSTGSIDNVAHLRDNPGFHFREGSILDPAPVLDLTGTCDAVVHLAAAVGVKYILENPFLSIRTNVRGTETVLETAARFSKPVLIASSSEVYGIQTKAPLSEDDHRVLGPTSVSRWSYASCKALDEFMALAYHGTMGLPVVVVRLFNVVGPRQTGAYGMVLPRFVQQALKGDPVTVYGDGSQTRTFSDVREIVPALADLMACDAARGEVVNLGGREEISIAGLAELVKSTLDSDSEIVFVPYDQAYGGSFEDMPRRVPDLSKVRKLIGFEPQSTTEDIIRRVADAMRR
ncbi:MAG: GDP-mannose 4,6-dehydratase [Planctomycetes bacterium]|nr:GDP-mannose 4,6-dehydratase [Planctomycetota bacterium]